MGQVIIGNMRVCLSPYLPEPCVRIHLSSEGGNGVVGPDEQDVCQRTDWRHQEWRRMEFREMARESETPDL